MFVRSADGGMSWAAPAPLSTDAATDDWLDRSPKIAAGANGTFIAAWWSFPNGDGEVLFSRSTDAGLTWAPAEALNADDDRYTDDLPPHIATDGAGAWAVTWRTGVRRLFFGADENVVLVRSGDDGATWTRPALVSSANASDGGISRLVLYPTLASGAAGSWTIIWEQDLQTTPSTHVFRVRAASSTQDCASVPHVDCLQSLAPGASKLRIRNSLDGRDKLTWSWTRGEASGPADIGDPTSTSDYTVCLYDSSAGVDHLIYEEDLRAAAVCDGAPCWRMSGGVARYKDSKKSRGATRAVTIRTGADGASLVKLSSAGPPLDPPLMPLDAGPSVKMQLVNLETGACWEATFSALAGNTADKLSASSD